jgi:2-oxo-4-hydroxy-4-carboxy--5-ureidoimidazoline (OHCU) decarboxylase
VKGEKTLVSFLTLYRGRTLEDAQLVAISTNDRIVKDFAERLLQERDEESDPALNEIRQGKRRALRIIKKED